jgi:hypothetical protein
MADSNPDKKPRITFRTGKPRIIFRKSKAEQSPITNPDGTPVRDKDNATPQAKPSYARRSAPNLAPPGMMGIRQPQQQAPRQTSESKHQPIPPDNQAGLSIDESVDGNSYWTSGKITTMPGYTFTAKVYDEPSSHGIEGGKISKLQIKKDGKQVVNYDRGWDERPKTPEQKEALHRIRNGLDNSPKKPFKGFKNKPDKGHGFDL